MNKVALYYIDDFRQEKYTYQDLMLLSNRFANVLRTVGQWQLSPRLS